MASVDTEIRFLEQSVERRLDVSLASRNPVMQACLGLAGVTAKAFCPVLITGESGVGKSLLAAYLHQSSPRGLRPLATIRCGGVVGGGELRERLFGKEGGAEGLLGEVAGGTLVLNDVERLPETPQRELVGILRDFARPPGAGLGAEGSGLGRRLGVRLVAVANVSGSGRVGAGPFLDELLFALGEVTIRVPPLRERREDIDYLVSLALEDANRKYGKMVTGLSRAAADFFRHYDFPGNVRELFQLVDRAVRVGGRDVVYVEDFGLMEEDGGEEGEFLLPLFEVEKRHIGRVLLRTGWKRSAAAGILGISRTMLNRKIRVYGLERAN